MIVNESILRDFMRLFVWFPLRWVISAIPVKCGYAVLRLMGDIHYLSGGGKKCIAENIRSGFADKAVDDKALMGAVRNYFRNHYVNQLQIFIFPGLNRSNMEQVHVFEGLEHLDNALKLGKGCILLHPHFGPTQLPLCALGMKGYKVTQLGLPTDEGLSFIGKEVSFRLRMIYEGKIPAKIVSAGSFLRPVLECLRNNGVLMMTGDGAGGNKFIGKFKAINFLGRPTLFPVGIASIVKKTNAPVLPMFTVIDPDFKYRSIIHGPVSMTDGPGKDDDLYITKEFVKILERYIYRFPYLWHFWDELMNRIVTDKDELSGNKDLI